MYIAEAVKKDTELLGTMECVNTDTQNQSCTVYMSHGHSKTSSRLEEQGFLLIVLLHFTKMLF